MGCAWADDFVKVNINGVDFEIPQEFSSGKLEKTRYVFEDSRTFAIMCVDDYIINNYGASYDIADYKQDLTIGNRPAKLLTSYNNYINDNVSDLYFPVNKSVYCICFRGNTVNSSISHIVESAPQSGMSSDNFYGLLKEAYDEHETRQYLDRMSDDDSYYVSKTHEQQKGGSNDQLVRWYLLSHW